MGLHIGRPLLRVGTISLLLVFVLLTGCGSGAAPATGNMSNSATDSTGSAGGEVRSPFPVTIEHKFGKTEIPSQPTRVVTLGFTEQDPVLALGVTPVAVREWFGDQPYAVWPWARDKLGDAKPRVLNMAPGELDFEAIAALRPDLIIAIHSGITEEEYRRLSAIAPTVAQPGDYPDYGVPWQEQTRIIGRALGREALAQQLVADVERKIEEARKRHPEFQGATVAMASPANAQGQYWVVGPNTPPMRFLSALGFRMPEPLTSLIGERDSALISGEQVRLLDVDVLIFQVLSAEGQRVIENDPLYRQLKVAAQGRTIFFPGVDDPIYGALAFSSVLSLPYALEHLIPKLAAAVDGDPATTAPSQ